jgi:hypothetical protein
MPQTIKNAAGEDEEVFSAAELAEKAEARANEIADTRVADATSKFEEEKAAAETRATAAEAASKTAADELTKLKAKDMNFEALRKSKGLTEEQEKDSAATAKALRDMQATVDEIRKQPIEAARTTFVESNFAADDKDGRDLFDFYYKKLSNGVTKIEDVQKAIVAAFNAATGGQRQPSRTGPMLHTSVNDNFSGGGARAESDASREFGTMLNVSADDKKRFGGAVSQGSVNLFAKRPVADK